LELNFSPDWQIKFDNESLDVEICATPNSINNFFQKNISNVIAIIGENGVGKTRILQYLLESFSYFASSKGVSFLKIDNFENLFISAQNTSYKKDIDRFIISNYAQKKDSLQ
jgi:flagellar biosynthesis GTPase FlhF